MINIIFGIYIMFDVFTIWNSYTYQKRMSHVLGPINWSPASDQLQKNHSKRVDICLVIHTPKTEVLWIYIPLNTQSKHMNSVIYQTFFISFKQMDNATCNKMTSINTGSCLFILCSTWAIRNSNVVNRRSKRIITPLCQPQCLQGTLAFCYPKLQAQNLTIAIHTP